MKQGYLYGAMEGIRNWLKQLFSGEENREENFGQGVFIDSVIMPSVKILETGHGKVAKDGTIYEDGRPVGVIETMDREMVITDHSTNEKLFIYDNGDIFDDNGLKLGTITKSGSHSTIRDTHGKNITLNHKVLKNLKIVCAV